MALCKTSAQGLRTAALRWASDASRARSCSKFDGEWMVLRYRTLDGREAINEIHRIAENEGIVMRTL